MNIYLCLQISDFPTGISQNVKFTENIRKDKSLDEYQMIHVFLKIYAIPLMLPIK